MACANRCANRPQRPAWERLGWCWASVGWTDAPAESLPAASRRRTTAPGAWSKWDWAGERGRWRDAGLPLGRFREQNESCAKVRATARHRDRCDGAKPKRRSDSAVGSSSPAATMPRARSLRIICGKIHRRRARRGMARWHGERIHDSEAPLRVAHEVASRGCVAGSDACPCTPFCTFVALHFLDGGWAVAGGGGALRAGGGALREPADRAWGRDPI